MHGEVPQRFILENQVQLKNESHSQDSKLLQNDYIEENLFGSKRADHQDTKKLEEILL